MKYICPVILLYCLAYTGAAFSENGIANLLEADGFDAQDKAFNALLTANRKLMNYQGNSVFIKSASRWLERKFSNWYSYHEEYSIANIHPSPGCELCFYVDDGILVFSPQGKLLGKINCSGTNVNVVFSELDFAPSIPSTPLKEVFIKESDVDGKFIIRILKFIDGEYQNVFNLGFRDSLWKQYISHPIFECIRPVPLKDGAGFVTNDEGEIKYWKYSVITKQYVPVLVDEFQVEK